MDMESSIGPEMQRNLQEVQQPPVKSSMINSSISKRPSPVIFGEVIESIQDRYDPTRCFQWVIRTDDYEIYRFSEKNVLDSVLLELLREKYQKRLRNNERVQFQSKQIIDKFGNKLQFANNVCLINEKPIKQNNEYREALLQFAKGKDYDNQILPIFLKEFEANPSKELANRICMIYMRSDDPHQTIDFIEKTKDLIGFTDAECLDYRYQVFRKTNEPEKAYEVSKSIIASTDITASKKRHYIELNIKYLLPLQRYDETVDYCEKWLTLGLGKDDEKNVSNVYRRRQICSTAAECIVKLQKSGSYVPNSQLLREINSDGQVAAILTSEVSEQAYVNSFDDLYFMGEIARDRIEGLNLLERLRYISISLHQVIDPVTKYFKGEPNKSLSDSALHYAYEFTKNIDAKIPYERYLSCIYAARVLYDALKRNPDKSDTYDTNILVHQMCTYLAKAMSSYGDYTIGVSRTAIKEEARLYYTESIKYADIEQADRQYAIMRCILSIFMDREDILASGSGQIYNKDQITKHLDNPEYANKLNICLFLGVIVRILNSVPPNQENSTQNFLVDAIYPSQCGKAIFRELNASLNNVLQEQVSKEKFITALNGFRNEYCKLEKSFILFMERVSEKICFKGDWIQDTQKDLDSMKVFFKYMDYFDRENCFNFMRDLLDRANKFYIAEHYDEREDCLKNMIARMEERDRIINDAPTLYSYEQLRKVLKAWQVISVKELHELYTKNPPELNCEIIGDGRVSADEDGIVNLSINISNKEERQKADNVEISIEKQDGVYKFLPLDQISSRIIKGGGQKDYILKLRIIERKLKAVTVVVTIYYTYKDENGSDIKGCQQNQLAVFFDENRKVDFNNPYTLYVSTGAVQDRSMTFGRDELINKTIKMLKGNDTTPLRSKMLLLYGQKRAGKSTVLWHLNNEIRKNINDAIVINFGDISSIATERFEEFFYKKFFDLFAAELQERHLPFYDTLRNAGVIIPDADRLKTAADGRYEMGRFFDRMNRFIAANSSFIRKTVVLLLDEFTYLYRWIKEGRVDTEFMKYWKSMISEYRLVAIAAAQDYIGDFIAAYPNQFGITENIPVDYLLREDVLEMIRRPFVDKSFWAAFDHKMGEEAINRIMKLTAGNAYFTMIFLDRLVEYLNKTNQPIVMPVIVENVLKQEILMGNNPFDLGKFDSLYNDEGDISDPNRPMQNLALLWAAALQCERGTTFTKDDIKIPEKVNDANKLTRERISFLIDKMVTRRVLIREEGRDAYRIRVDMFREWLLTNCGADLINRQEMIGAKQ